MLETGRNKLHHFYNNNSHFLHERGNTEAEPVVGKDEIKGAIMKASSLFKKDTPIKVDTSCGTIDAQESADGGVIMLVTGVVYAGVKGEPDFQVNTFVQNFYLAPQGTDGKSASFFVLNDTFRLLDPPQPPASQKVEAVEESVEVVVEESVTPIPAPTPTAPTQTPSPALTPPAAEPTPVAEVELPPASEPEVAVVPVEPEVVKPTGPLTWAQRAAAKKVDAPPVAPMQAQAPMKQAVGDVAAAEGGSTAVVVEEKIMSLYLKGLPEGVTEDKLRELFKSHGDIKNVNIIADRKYAFVDYKKTEGALAALAAPAPKIGDVALIVEPRLSRNATVAAGGNGTTNGGVGGGGGGGSKNKNKNKNKNKGENGGGGGGGGGNKDKNNKNNNKGGNGGGNKGKDGNKDGNKGNSGQRNQAGN